MEVTTMNLLAAALLMFIALPALAVTRQPRDFLLFRNAYGPGGREAGAIIHRDAVTGVETVVSCWAFCAPTIGAGRQPTNFITENLTVSVDGLLYFASTTSVFSVDLASGDRALLFDEPDPALVIWPAHSFFTPTVATLGGWGLAMLVVGVVIRVQLRGLRLWSA